MPEPVGFGVSLSELLDELSELELPVFFFFFFFSFLSKISPSAIVPSIRPFSSETAMIMSTWLSTLKRQPLKHCSTDLSRP